MAEIVLGLGSSHGPPVTMPAELWHMLMEKDQVDKRMDYNALVKTAPANIEEEFTLERKQGRAGQFANLSYHEHSNATAPEVPRPCEAAPELADHLIRYLRDGDFDI